MQKQHRPFEMIHGATRWGSRVGCLAMVIVTSACSPTLNWRDVTVDRLRVNLPCKPDNAQRPVVLAGATLELAMAGCKAADALFAVSHAKVPSGVLVKDVLITWQLSTLENMQVNNAKDVLDAYQAAETPKSAVDIRHVAALQVVGVSPEGSAVQANLVWFVVDRDVYHLAVYAPAIKPEMVEPLFSQAQLL
jgi:hypothetical protein